MIVKLIGRLLFSQYKMKRKGDRLGKTKSTSPSRLLLDTRYNSIMLWCPNSVRPVVQPFSSTQRQISTVQEDRPARRVVQQRKW